MSSPLIIILTACLVAISASCVGVWLVLRRQSLISDAIGHSVLPGVVVATLLVGTYNSLVIFVGATLAGFFTVALIEKLSKKYLKDEAAIAVVFPFLFSIGIILISLYFRNIHFDTDTVLFGEIAYAPFNITTVLGHSVYESIFIISISVIVNLIFLLLFYPQLKLSSFDKITAQMMNFSPSLISNILMFLTSLTTVLAFQYVGIVFIVSFIIAPASIAYLCTNRLKNMILLSFLIGIIASILGYFAATKLDLSITGAISSILGLFFIFTTIFTLKK